MHFRSVTRIGSRDLPLNCNKTDMKECAIYDNTMWKYYNILEPNFKNAIKSIFNPQSPSSVHRTRFEI